MSEIDEWFSGIINTQKLIVLGYPKNWNLELCTNMTIEDFILLIEIPPIDNTNPACPKLESYNFHAITKDLYLSKWDRKSVERRTKSVRI